LFFYQFKFIILELDLGPNYKKILTATLSTGSRENWIGWCKTYKPQQISKIIQTLIFQKTSQKRYACFNGSFYIRKLYPRTVHVMKKLSAEEWQDAWGAINLPVKFFSLRLFIATCWRVNIWVQLSNLSTVIHLRRNNMQANIKHVASNDDPLAI
jgi:hypothetical protein